MGLYQPVLHQSVLRLDAYCRSQSFWARARKRGERKTQSEKEREQEPEKERGRKRERYPEIFK